MRMLIADCVTFKVRLYVTDTSNIFYRPLAIIPRINRLTAVVNPRSSPLVRTAIKPPAAYRRNVHAQSAVVRNFLI